MQSICQQVVTHGQWGRQNFSAARAQPGHLNLDLDWGTFKKLCIPSLFLVEASSYTVKTNGSTNGRKCSLLWENGSPQFYKTTLETRNTFCGMWYLPYSQVYNDKIVPIITVILHIFHCACTKPPYFHFRS